MIKDIGKAAIAAGVGVACIKAGRKISKVIISGVDKTADKIFDN